LKLKCCSKSGAVCSGQKGLSKVISQPTLIYSWVTTSLLHCTGSGESSVCEPMTMQGWRVFIFRRAQSLMKYSLFAVVKKLQFERGGEKVSLRTTGNGKVLDQDISFHSASCSSSPFMPAHHSGIDSTRSRLVFERVSRVGQKHRRTCRGQWQWTRWCSSKKLGTVHKTLPRPLCPFSCVGSLEQHNRTGDNDSQSPNETLSMLYAVFT
jgi:hypothetical protein